MKKFTKLVGLPVILLVIVAAYWTVYQRNTFNSTPQTIEFIREHITSGGKLVDYNNEIGVKSVDNIKLFVKEKEIKIQFGELLMKWKPEEFISRENRELLEKIGITMFKDKKTGKLRVYYYEDEIVRWVS